MEHTNHPVALITGASKGIGKAITLALVQDGYKVCLLARSKDKLEETAQFIKTNFSLSPDAQPEIYPANVTDEQQVHDAIEKILQKNSKIDVFVNNAGMGNMGTIDLPLDSFRELVEINLIGAFNIVRLVAKQMRDQKNGYIFNIASMAGKRAMAKIGGYAATKFGLVGLNEALFDELTPYNVKVTAICPSIVDTEMTADFAWITNDEKIQTDDIVHTVRYLLQLSPSALVKEVLVNCRKTLLPAT